MSEHEGVGPDGANLLGFLAAVGTLVTLTHAWPERNVRMSWVRRVAWRPVWHVEADSTEDELLDALYRELARRADAPEFNELGDSLPVEADVFRRSAYRAAESATPSDRRFADFLAAFGCDAVTDREGRIQDTALRAVGGGKQRFLAFMRTLARETTRDHVRAALFELWHYEDGAPSMRWDPADDRRYAYRADNPATSSQFPIRTVRGANRLAIEALPCFPTVPRRRRLETAAFSAVGGRPAIRWPIWDAWLTVHTLQSLLIHPALGTPLDAVPLHAQGVVEVFRSRRITEGQYRNFTPAEALLGGVRTVAR